MLLDFSQRILEHESVKELTCYSGCYFVGVFQAIDDKTLFIKAECVISSI